MQSRHSYPSHRNQYPVAWLARPGATVDDAPLPPKTADRTRAIRRIFLEDFHGRATIDQVGAASEDAGLLDDLRTPRSMREAVMKALRPLKAESIWTSAWRPTHVSPPSAPG